MPASERLGFQFLVRFNVNGNPVVTVRQKDVERVFCPSPTEGKVNVADLTDAHPAFHETWISRVGRGLRQDHDAGRVITMASTQRHAVVIGASMAGVLAARALTDDLRQGHAGRPGPDALASP